MNFPRRSLRASDGCTGVIVVENSDFEDGYAAKLSGHDVARFVCRRDQPRSTVEVCRCVGIPCQRGGDLRLDPVEVLHTHHSRIGLGEKALPWSVDRSARPPPRSGLKSQLNSCVVMWLHSDCVPLAPHPSRFARPGPGVRDIAALTFVSVVKCGL